MGHKMRRENANKNCATVPSDHKIFVWQTSSRDIPLDDPTNANGVTFNHACEISALLTMELQVGLLAINVLKG